MVSSQMLSMPDKFKVALLQASTKNNYFYESTNQINIQGIPQRRYILDGVHFM